MAVSVAVAERANGLLVTGRFEDLWALCEENARGDGAGGGCCGPRAALCALGVQALAEMERWAEVLPWVLAQYGSAGNLPAQVLQLCILLMSRVGKPEMVLDVARAWLHERVAPRRATPDPTADGGGHRATPMGEDQTQDGSALVAELHLMYVLLPLRRWGEAEGLLSSMTEVWESWRGDRAQVLLQEARERAASMPKQEPCDQQQPPLPAQTNGDGISSSSSISSSRPGNERWGRVCRTLLAVMSVAGAPVRQAALFLFLLSMLLFQLDPASPAALRPTSALVRMLVRAWRATMGRLYPTH
ncbi:peroxisome assembly protein 26 [Lethenteron reissneri]|uniref:peroxisome assembly protein 26 n=1 Tax=Lethenteron reissneri TaxID=7753 RepID=UPI002AB78906|nr:peroxisome assembly protein 26 [Lethenteron reissneri]